MTTIDGTSLRETLKGTNGADIIHGLGGDDYIVGYAGNDVLDGGDGNDALSGGPGDDQLIGGAGADTAYYSAATGAVTVDLRSTFVQNTGGAGNDMLSSVESLFGSQYADRLIGNASANKLAGGVGNDSLYGSGGDDLLYGGDGNDRLNGGPGNDLLNGGNGTDMADYSGSSGAVLVNLSVKTAQYTQGAGADTLVSIEGAVGSAYSDSLIGDDGNNRLSGGGGNDYLTGGAGADRLTGGTGSDYFYYDQYDNGDVLTDFVSGIDHIDLFIVWESQFTFIGAAEFSGSAGEGRFDNGLFQLDYDGDGNSDLSFAVPGQLVASDIIVASPWDY